jgi:murein DD-endopeptidase MepM/ murein hydrolase activator NlpD
MPEYLFPELSNKHFVEVNLDQQAQLRQKQEPKLKSTAKENPFLDPVVCDGFVLEVSRKFNADFNYGGYLENRGFLWRTSYLDTTGSYLHLGVDFNVPKGTQVAALFPGKVVRIDDDYDLEGGWGPRVIIQPDPMFGKVLPVCIFAHLFAPQVNVGDRVNEGTVIATIGGAPYNGNWFPHLHVQCVEIATFKKLMEEDLRTLDGYGHERDRQQLLQKYPDPLQFNWLVGSPFCK